MDGYTSEKGTPGDEVATAAVVTPTVDFLVLLSLTLGVAAALVVLL